VQINITSVLKSSYW